MVHQGTLDHLCRQFSKLFAPTDLVPVVQLVVLVIRDAKAQKDLAEILESAQALRHLGHVVHLEESDHLDPQDDPVRKGHQAGLEFCDLAHIRQKDLLENLDDQDPLAQKAPLESTANLVYLEDLEIGVTQEVMGHLVFLDGQGHLDRQVAADLQDHVHTARQQELLLVIEFGCHILKFYPNCSRDFLWCNIEAFICKKISITIL